MTEPDPAGATTPIVRPAATRTGAKGAARADTARVLPGPQSPPTPHPGKAVDYAARDAARRKKHGTENLPLRDDTADYMARRAM